MDLVLGTHLYNKASAELQKLFIQQQDYMVIYQGDYRLSGLKIISYLGQKVIRHSTSSWLTLNNQFTKREPVYKMSALYTEVNQILAIKDDLYNQKHPVEEPTYFAVLHNAVSELIELPQLIVPLAMPVKDCEKRYHTKRANPLIHRVCRFKLCKPNTKVYESKSPGSQSFDSQSFVTKLCE